MAKISLISWRRREKKFPETEAQRRALARERGTDSNRRCSFVEEADGLAAVPPVELLELGKDYLLQELEALPLLSSVQFPQAVEKNSEASAEACISMGLTADQGRVFDILPSLSAGFEANAPRELFQLRNSQDHGAIMLRFSLQTQTIPEMLSLKEVCYQLKVGRRTIMQLIRRRDLRCYRIVHRYRFAIEDIKNYLERVATN